MKNASQTGPNPTGGASVLLLIRSGNVQRASEMSNAFRVTVSGGSFNTDRLLTGGT